MLTWSSNKRKDIPDGLWVKCSECGEIIYNGELTRNLRICPRCGYYFPLEPDQRIALLADKGSFLRYDADSAAGPDEGSCDRAIITGEATLSGHRLVIAAIDLSFANGTIGSSICEKLVRAVAQVADQRLPLLLICTNSTIGARHAVPVYAAMSELTREKLLYVSVLAHSNSHGDFPGFAYVADVVIAESNIPRTPAKQVNKTVTTDTNVLATRSGEGTLPPRTGRRTCQNGAAHAAKTSFENGMVDMIVSRRELKYTLSDILSFFC